MYRNVRHLRTVTHPKTPLSARNCSGFQITRLGSVIFLMIFMGYGQVTRKGGSEYILGGNGFPL
jgi:hypothetical protein